MHVCVRVCMRVCAQTHILLKFQIAHHMEADFHHPVKLRSCGSLQPSTRSVAHLAPTELSWHRIAR